MPALSVRVSKMNLVNCTKHGIQEETFVCQHIVKGLEENQPYGFHYPEESDEKRPNAWCSSCNDFLKKENWEWTDRVLEVAQVKLLCGVCYDVAKLKNGQ